MRFKKDPDIRPYNPILFDTCGNMHSSELWSMIIRLEKEAKEHMRMMALKNRTIEILEQELECRGEITRDYR